MVKKCVVFSMLLIVCSQAVAQVGQVGVQFVQQGPALTSGQVAGVVPQGNFNAIQVNNSTGTTGTAYSLVDADGNITNTTLYHTSNDGYNSHVSPTTPNGILLFGEDKSGPAGDNQGSNQDMTATYTFSNLMNLDYDVIAYIENDCLGVNAALTVGPVTYYVTDECLGAVYSSTQYAFPGFSCANNTDPNALVTGNYVEFYGVTPVNGQITLTNMCIGGGNDTSSINGLQLVPISTPEPSMLALLGAGAIALLGYNWRRRRQKLTRESSGQDEAGSTILSFLLVGQNRNEGQRSGIPHSKAGAGHPYWKSETDRSPFRKNRPVVSKMGRCMEPKSILLGPPRSDFSFSRLVFLRHVRFVGSRIIY